MKLLDRRAFLHKAMQYGTGVLAAIVLDLRASPRALAARHGYNPGAA
jgi:hypothetical protein